MTNSNEMLVHRLTPSDVPMLREMVEMFGEAFGDRTSYQKEGPSAAYLERLLGSDTFIALAALHAGKVVGGLAAYELRKFEQERSEIYIYDLAVAEPYRRKRIATALIEELKRIGAAVGAWVIFVQADYGDEPAIALYEKLGVREEVLHYDIQIKHE